MLETIDLQQVLVLDIETVSQKANYTELPDNFQELWTLKMQNSLNDGQSAADVYPDAGLYAEFGKIICISVGVFHQQHGQTGFRVKSFAHVNEKELLAEFSALLRKQPSNLTLCAHNGKGFDFPYLCKRMLINGVALPRQLDLSGKKPWEISHLDTMELWRFGDFRNAVSLNLMAAVLGIPSPKDDISGKDVFEVYYGENNLGRIRVYCEKDVITTAQILRRLRNEPLITQEAISFAE
ncbi:3'-5' exonuclease [Parapedobacter pyrenivorans]|uniref:3'-5' exonuclease n=1 Tax=Parapedobacter pyrenivorans TaxID=1305674 RepID=A0A917HS20_9SPHI|nr:3'-5' exonuclease [Parapedobacter pyrenivorans]GGG87551.1 3'-5' exonuclease [Parapedobacter pyrenivorans]